MAKVLIVDDSRTSRNILKKILEKAGHSIIGEATNGEEAYLEYKSLQPDVVTMDITMPKMDGIEALQLIRKYDENAVVIMITAAGQKEKMIQAIKYGASDFIAKPYEAENVLEIIHKFTEE